MYPTVDGTATYAAQSHPSYVIPAALPNYGNPQPYAAPYITSGTRVPLRTQRWSTGLCRCHDDPANCKNTETMWIHLFL